MTEVRWPPPSRAGLEAPGRVRLGDAKFVRQGQVKSAQVYLIRNAITITKTDVMLTYFPKDR